MAKSPILGTFSGKCCDSNVMNNNDMHLGREVFETLLASEDYKRAMENRHYIGYLGHPSDPDCQDYEHACIVMTDQRLLDNGEVEADFDLIDTPVGRVVKSFTDAGVNFGISIRGVGEVDGQGEVDPDQFIFRGYDLVTFPAYDDCIPVFREIAASTDVKKKANYKKICASIDANLKDITSTEALEIIKDQFPEGDAEVVKIQERIDELNNPEDTAIIAEVNQQKLTAVTDLYLEAAAKVRDLECKLADCQSAKDAIVLECSTLKRKDARLNKIVANQIEAANQTVDAAEKKSAESNKKLSEIRANLVAARRELKVTRDELEGSKRSYNQQVVANSRLREKLTSFTSKNKDDQEAIKASQNLNLKYQRKIENSSKLLSQKDEEIAQLNERINETVVASKKLSRDNKDLIARVTAAEEMLASYQQAYANLYANALGVYLTGLPVTASTTVEELKEMISAGTSTANIAARPAYSTDLIDTNEDEEDGEEYIHGEDDDFDDTQYRADLVNM